MTHRTITRFLRYLLQFTVLIVTVFGITFTFAGRVFAAGEFQADYDVQYAVSPAGKTIVTQHVALINRLSNFYPRQYSLLLDSDKITNVIAYDDGGVITPDISVKDGKTEIKLSFNTKNVGLGKATSFSLRYEHSGIASKNGSIWEVYVPGITNDPDIGQYDVTLSIPPTFGPAAYLSPNPARGNVWTKDQMIQGGISGAYGSAQVFSVSLTYSLANTSIAPQNQVIALPPDTAYQKVSLESLDPKPDAMQTDSTGNWLAQYNLLPSQRRSIRAVMSIFTYLTPRDGYTTKKEDLSVYLTPKKYWETEDPRIQELARQYKTPKDIYTYVSRTLTYDYKRASTASERSGAVGALNDPKRSVCTEFTDLFIAIARAAGIPARRNVGYAYTNNPKLRPLSLVSDVLHAWPEYFDSARGMWIPVDPTWANTTGGSDYFTKLDFNHIVFAINGTDSTLPYPAGFYRTSEAPSRDVNVSFSESKPKPSTARVISVIEFPSQMGAGTSAAGAVAVTNEGNESAYAIEVSAQSENFRMAVSKVIPELLPFQTIRVPFTITAPQSFRSLPGRIEAKVNDASLSREFSVRPIIWLIGLITVFAIVGIVIVTKLGQLLIWKVFRKK